MIYINKFLTSSGVWFSISNHKTFPGIPFQLLWFVMYRSIPGEIRCALQCQNLINWYCWNKGCTIMTILLSFPSCTSKCWTSMTTGLSSQNPATLSPSWKTPLQGPTSLLSWRPIWMKTNVFSTPSTRQLMPPVSPDLKSTLKLVGFNETLLISSEWKEILNGDYISVTLVMSLWWLFLHVLALNVDFLLKVIQYFCVSHW